MNQPLPTLRDSQMALLEALALLAALTLYVAAMLLGISIDVQIYATVALLCTLLVLCWRNSGGGMHPCFLFLGLLLLFQGGRFVAYCLFPSVGDPLRLYSADHFFDVTLSTKHLTLLVIPLSAVFVYVSARLFGLRAPSASPPLLQIKNYILIIFSITLPFLIWKNYLYLAFVKSHGGYMAIYLANAEMVAQAGPAVRLLAHICSTSFLMYFAYERAGLRLICVSAVFFSVSVMELVLGLRGEVIGTVLGCVFLWKRKRGTHFSLRSLGILVVSVAMTAQVIASTREGGEETDVEKVPSMFLMSQGTSLQVPEILISNYQQFARRRFEYLSNSPITAFVIPQHFAQGQVFERDLSIYADPRAEEAGFELGGSYIADGYLIGGVFGTIAVAVFIGTMLSYLSRYLTGTAAPYALGMMLCVVYLPRTPLLLQLALGVGTWAYMSLILACALMLRRIKTSIVGDCI